MTAIGVGLGNNVHKDREGIHLLAAPVSDYGNDGRVLVELEWELQEAEEGEGNPPHTTSPKTSYNTTSKSSGLTGVSGATRRW